MWAWQGRKGGREERTKEGREEGAKEFRLFIYFLWPHPRYMEVPGLRVELELQLLAYATARATQDLGLCHISWQGQISDPLSEARDPHTHGD